MLIPEHDPSDSANKADAENTFVGSASSDGRDKIAGTSTSKPAGEAACSAPDTHCYDEDYAAIDPASLSPDQQFSTDEIGTTVASQAKGAAPLVEGSLWKAIWTMSWPLLVTTIATSICGFVDVQVAGKIGSSAQAAVGLAEQVIFLFSLFIMSMGIGTTAIISRAYGERDEAQADHMAGQSLALSVLSGIVLTMLAIFTAKYLVPFFTQSPDVVAQGDLYLSVFALYMVPFSLICIVNASFRAIGDARMPLVIVVTEVIINVVGDYATVLGNWPVPGLGIRGIAYSAVAGALVSSALAIIFINRSPLKRATGMLLPLSWTAIKRVLRLGIPSAFQRISWAASVFVLFFILSRVPDPTAALASWTIGMRVEALLFMPLFALSLAVSSIVGQNLGAKEVARAIKAGWHVTWIGVAMMLVLGTGMFFFANELAKMISHDPSTIAYTASYLRINAVCEPFLAINMILSGALQGAGDTRVPMWASVFGNWVVRLPLAWFLAIYLGWGPSGAWWSMTTSIVVSTIIVAVRFQTGGWVHQRV
jgi:MATE family multidrug resistance protein